MSTIKEAVEWVQIYWHDEKESEKLKRVLLIGDSIVVGHGSMLRDALYGKFGLDFFGTSKIVCDHEYWKDLKFVLGRKKYELIIFNNGLHGRCISDAEYASALKEVIEKLKTYAPIIAWRNSTPCFTLDSEKPNLWVSRVPERNAVALDVVKKASIPIIDAYSLLKDHSELSADGIHWKKEGYQAIVNAEKSFIEETLK